MSRRGSSSPESALPPRSDEGAKFHEGDEAPPPGVRVMAVLRWVLVAVVAAAAAGSVLHFSGVLRGDAPPKTTRYQCPMHPQIIQDGPGDCPICNMALVLIDEKPAAPAAPSQVPGLVAVEIPAERRQLIGVRTAPVLKKPLLPEVRALATVVASERGRAALHARVAGWIRRVYVQETGRKVALGQPLATLDSPELLAAQQEYLEVLRWSPTAATGSHGSPADRPPPSLALDARARLLRLGIAKAEIDTLERTLVPLAEIALRSPATGTLVARAALPGAYVQPGTELFTFADLTTVWAIADVPESEIGRVAVGLPARLRLAAFPDRTYTGTVAFLAPEVSSASRTLRVRVELANRDGDLRPGMTGEIALELAGAAGLVVPADAVVRTGTAEYAFVDMGGGRFEPRAVRAGARIGDEVEVLSGLREAEQVVVSGGFLVDSESRLRAALEGFATPSAAAAP